ncbi:MAG: PLP-dependent transferase [Acidaminococcales bacterium]|jgi:threonine aldolase|nr:PLP-dependent transferase [Acidaminococcales bacterium]
MIDLRSDTVTVPTEKMRLAMASAQVGDDVYGEDPTVNLLEKTVAAACGMEAAMFAASGTMGNQAAVMSYAGRGDEVICEESAHVFLYEGAGIAGLSGAQARPVKGRNGVLAPDVLESYVRPANDVHQPLTKLICLENTHNHAGGNYYRLEELSGVAAVARKYGIKVHMDGARVMNAAVALKVKLSSITAHVDSISICLSKGLGAPVGAVVAGAAEFIAKARRARKRMGGGMRQAGILAAAGLVAFNEMAERLEDDHRRARALAEGCLALGFEFDAAAVKTNIVIVPADDPDRISAALKAEGVLANKFGAGRFRMVTHYGIDDDAVDYTLEKLKKIKNG